MTSALAAVVALLAGLAAFIAAGVLVATAELRRDDREDAS